ncbi:MAG: lytic murein transglycosylase [Desulfobacteraceae bacterium]|jgi:membrane-bound lytic murein transglycosylase B
MVRHGYKWGRNRLILVILLLIAGDLIAAESGAAVEPDKKPFLSVQKQLIADGFDPKKIMRLYGRPQVSFEADGVIVLFTYKEAHVDYGQFTNKWSILKARQYMQDYDADLTRIEKAYGVDKKIITAILLVETGLGASVGTRLALNTLSTMAALTDPMVRSKLWDLIPNSKKISRKKFERRAAARSKWAYEELKALLKYSAREGVDPVSIPGSFAGAVGVAQFMPTNILAYGKDGNDDGVVDMLNHADAMASIANFLKRHGWRPGQSRKKAAKIIYHYNHSNYYVNTILKISSRLKS